MRFRRSPGHEVHRAGRYALACIFLALDSYVGSVGNSWLLHEKSGLTETKGRALKKLLPLLTAFARAGRENQHDVRHRFHADFGDFSSMSNFGV